MDCKPDSVMLGANCAPQCQPGLLGDVSWSSDSDWPISSSDIMAMSAHLSHCWSGSAAGAAEQGGSDKRPVVGGSNVGGDGGEAAVCGGVRNDDDHWSSYPVSSLTIMLMNSRVSMARSHAVTWEHTNIRDLNAADVAHLICLVLIFP